MAAGVYTGVLRDGVRALKYRGIRGVATPLGCLAAGALAEVPPDATVVAVPPPARRSAERGVDHARLLAVAVAEGVGCSADTGVLVRTRATRSQVGLDPAARRRNVRGAFTVSVDVRDRSMILVDDVLTTGATAGECAQALLDAGAAVVDVCTVARAIGLW